MPLYSAQSNENIVEVHEKIAENPDNSCSSSFAWIKHLHNKVTWSYDKRFASTHIQNFSATISKPTEELEIRKLSAKAKSSR